MTARLPDWIPTDCEEFAADHTLRDVRLPDAPAWLPISDGLLELRVIELSRETGRLVAEIRTSEAEARLRGCRGSELYVRQGTLTSAEIKLSRGGYLRLPPEADHDDEIMIGTDALITVAMGQISVDDTELRMIDTTEDSAWFNGPVDGVEVLPLHGHGTANVMLVRWEATAAFSPNIDPAGEEVFVITGALHDSTGTYAAGSWIRNPLPAWQSWAGTPGTLVWYKSGHFPD